MKLGNVSQSIIPVPKFFLNKKTIDLFTSYNTTEAKSSERNTRKIKKRKKILKKIIEIGHIIGLKIFSP